MPSFHCDRTSSHEYKWNSTSCPEGVPRKKKGISTAKAAIAIDISGAHTRLPPRASREKLLATLLATLLEPSSPPDFMFAASFAATRPPAELLSRAAYMFAQGRKPCTELTRRTSHVSQSWTS